MADQESAAAQPDAGDAPPTGLKSKLPLIAMMAVGLAIGGGTGAMVVGPMVARKTGKVIPAHADSTAGHDGASASGGEHGGEAGGEAGGGEASVHLLENLVLNPAGSGGSRFLLLTVAIETGSADIASAMTSRDAELRDIILTSLGSKSVDQLTEIGNREAIKSELQGAIAERFGKTSVKRLYFPQFVVQ